MQRIVRRATVLLEEWYRYRDIQCGPKTRFASAIDIEVERDVLATYASNVRTILGSDTWDSPEFKFIVDGFGDHLAVYKDMVTLELLRNGKNG